MNTWTERDAVKLLKKIVEDAEGDDLTRAENLFGHLNGRDLDTPQQGSLITPREILTRCRKNYALWKKAEKLLLALLEDAGISY